MKRMAYVVLCALGVSGSVRALSVADIKSSLREVLPAGTYVGSLSYKPELRCFVKMDFRADDTNQFSLSAHVQHWRHNWQRVTETHIVGVSEIRNDNRLLTIRYLSKSPIDKGAREFNFWMDLDANGQATSVDFRERNFLGIPGDEMPHCIGLKKISDSIVDDLELANRYGN